MKSFCPCSQCSHLNVFMLFPLWWVDAPEGLDDVLTFFFELDLFVKILKAECTERVSSILDVGGEQGLTCLTKENSA